MYKTTLRTTAAVEADVDLVAATETSDGSAALVGSIAAAAAAVAFLVLALVLRRRRAQASVKQAITVNNPVFEGAQA